MAVFQYINTFLDNYINYEINTNELTEFNNFCLFDCYDYISKFRVIITESSYYKNFFDFLLERIS